MVTDMVADMEVDKAADMAEVNISTYYFFSSFMNFLTPLPFGKVLEKVSTLMCFMFFCGQIKID